MSHKRASILALAAVLAVTLTACGDDEAQRDETGAVAEAGQMSVFRLEVGDCLVDVATGEFTAANVVPCAEPHMMEVYLAFDLPGGSDAEFPGTSEVIDIASQRCLEAFEPFVGAPYETSQYGYQTLYPSEQSWRAVGDREVLCLIGNFEQTPKTGSARSTAR